LQNASARIKRLRTIGIVKHNGKEDKGLKQHLSEILEISKLEAKESFLKNAVMTILRRDKENSKIVHTLWLVKGYSLKQNLVIQMFMLK